MEISYSTLLSMVKQYLDVTEEIDIRFAMDSKVEYEISMHLGRHKNIKFTWCGNGLYYFDTAKIGHVKTPQDEITDDDKTDKSKI